MFMQDIRHFEPAQPVDLLARFLNRQPGGVAGATLIETEGGWRRADALLPGMRVATWDGGFRPLVAVDTARRHPAGRSLIRVPGGVLNNCGPVWLDPDQQVLIQSPVVAAVLEAEAALLPAAALKGYRGISRLAQPAPMGITTLRLAEDEVIFAASGLCLHCPAGQGADAGYHPALDLARGRDLMALIGCGALRLDELPRAA